MAKTTRPKASTTTASTDEATNRNERQEGAASEVRRLCEELSEAIRTAREHDLVVNVTHDMKAGSLHGITPLMWRIGKRVLANGTEVAEAQRL